MSEPIAVPQSTDQSSGVVRDESIVGTMDELEPILRARGYTAVRTMAGPIDLAAFDPYGMRRVGSVNIQTERWASHVWRGCFATYEGRPYLTEAKVASNGFLNGMFPLI